MAILEKEILVKVGTVNTKYYEKLGYEIPRYKNEVGKLVVKKGTKILVKVEDLSEGSNVKVTKICDECGKVINNQGYDHIIKSRKNSDGKDRCNICGRKQASITRKSNTPYKKSLEYYAKNNKKEYLLDEFSNKNNKKPHEI